MTVDRYEYKEIAEVPALFSDKAIVLYNSAKRVCDNPVTIVMLPQAWAYGFSMPSRRTVLNGTYDALVIHLTFTIEQGQVRIGAVAEGLREFLSDEIEVTALNGRQQTVSVAFRSCGRLSALLVRTGEDDSVPPIVRVHSVKAFAATASLRPHLKKVTCPEIPNLLTTQPDVEPLIVSANGAATTRLDPGLDGTTLLVTHSSRRFDPARCGQSVLSARYSADPERLAKLPPFFSLPSRDARPSYTGPLTILNVRVNEESLALIAERCFDTADCVSHACMLGGRLILCFENFLYVLQSPDAILDDIFIEDDTPAVIHDNWFCDLHTVFPVDDNTCIVSGSSADAVFWVDIPSREVIRRWRLPCNVYGTNYDLTEAMSLHDHFINTDMQLGHLNCAYPDGAGGCVVSVLGQGDVGHIDAQGKYQLLAHGYVGCHGARYSLDRSYIYFAASCTGQLLAVLPDGTIEELIAVRSRWLQDVQQLTENIFAFSMVDRDEISIIDVRHKRELGRFCFGARGNTVGFVSAVPLLAR